jgi:hypothetical protein
MTFKWGIHNYDINLIMTSMSSYSKGSQLCNIGYNIARIF